MRSACTGVLRAATLGTDPVSAYELALTTVAPEARRVRGLGTRGAMTASHREHGNAGRRRRLGAAAAVCWWP